MDDFISDIVQRLTSCPTELAKKCRRWWYSQSTWFLGKVNVFIRTNKFKKHSFSVGICKTELAWLSGSTRMSTRGLRGRLSVSMSTWTSCWTRPLRCTPRGTPASRWAGSCSRGTTSLSSRARTAPTSREGQQLGHWESCIHLISHFRDYFVCWW